MTLPRSKSIPWAHERDVQWVEILPWHLQTHLPSTGVAKPGDSAVCLEGIDIYASVFVNDVRVLSANNAHRSWTTLPFPCDRGRLDHRAAF